MKFLIDNGYKKYNEKLDSFGTTGSYQKRIDTIKEYEHYPLCQCNDKLFLNILHSCYQVNGQPYEGFEMFLVHENKAGDWCDLKIYSLNEEKILANLGKYEKQLLNMWQLFYKGE